MLRLLPDCICERWAFTSFIALSDKMPAATILSPLYSLNQGTWWTAPAELVGCDGSLHPDPERTSMAFCPCV